MVKIELHGLKGYIAVLGLLMVTEFLVEYFDGLGVAYLYSVNFDMLPPVSPFGLFVNLVKMYFVICVYYVAVTYFVAHFLKRWRP